MNKFKYLGRMKKSKKANHNRKDTPPITFWLWFFGLGHGFKVRGSVILIT